MKVGAQTVCNGEGFKCLPRAVSLIKPAVRAIAAHAAKDAKASFFALIRLAV